MKAKHTPGERITELRKTYSITRETLAERSGLEIELIRRIEEAGHIPDLAPLVKIARALGPALIILMGKIITAKIHKMIQKIPIKA
jgi:transcriptional regulator with XRE-family HTH domain